MWQRSTGAPVKSLLPATTGFQIHVRRIVTARTGKRDGRRSMLLRFSTPELTRWRYFLVTFCDMRVAAKVQTFQNMSGPSLALINRDLPASTYDCFFDSQSSLPGSSRSESALRFRGRDLTCVPPLAARICPAVRVGNCPASPPKSARSAAKNERDSTDRFRPRFRGQIPAV